MAAPAGEGCLRTLERRKAEAMTVLGLGIGSEMGLGCESGVGLH
jgi:hypothetical protein